MKLATMSKAFRKWSLLLAFCGMASSALAQEAQSHEAKYQLKVSPPRQAVQNADIRIGIEYFSPTDMPPGKAKVTYHNVDTGQDFVKTMEIPFAKGKQKVEVVWKGDEKLPHGLYVIAVELTGADGKPLAHFASSPDQVRTMMTHGGAFTRLVNPEQVVKEVEDLKTWQAELEKLEVAASAAGADTTRQKILIVVLKQATFWSGESISGKRYDILEENHNYLKREVAKAKEQLETLAGNPNAYPKEVAVSRPKERLTIRDRGFYAGDQQVFLSGPCFFGFTIKYLPVARELGFNVIQVSVGPDSVFPESTEPTGTPRIDAGMKKGAELLPILDQCAELGLKVDLGMTSHFMPKWVYQKWPDARNQFCLYGMQPYDIEHPEMLKMVERFFDTVMPIIAKHPAINSIWIANEPEYMNPNERNMAIFRPWLEQKYKTIDNLNKTWGTQLKSFDDIVASGRKGNSVPDAASTDGAKLDWWKYSTERLMHHYDWQRNLIHKYDPDVPVSAKLYNGTWNPGFKPMSRADEESTFDLFKTYMGMDGGSFGFSKPYKDFLRSLEPSQPMANLEYKFGGDLTKLFFWQDTMQGVSDFNWWAWHPNANFSSVPKYAVSMHLAALAKLDIQRLLPQINAFNKPPRAPMVLLYPDPVAPRYWEYFGFNDPTNRALTEMGYNVDYASEKRVAMGRLDDYQVLVMPAANFITDATYAKVKAFIENGKTAIVLGAIPDQNEYGQPRDASFFKPQGPAQQLAFGEFKAVKFAAGKGTIYHLPEVPRSPDGKNHLTKDSAKLIQDVLQLALTETLPPQPVVIRNDKGKPFIEYRSTAYSNGSGEKSYLTYVVNEWLDAPQTIEPKYSFKIKACRDLISQKMLDPKRISIPPADVMLLEFTVAP